MALGPGSIAVTGFNADGNDALAFVALEELPAGTVLYFSDNEWNGTTFTDFAENVFSLTLSAAVPAGTVVTINEAGAATRNSPFGTIATVAGGGSNLGISNGDEVVYVYLADAATPLVPTTFLTAVANGGFSAVNGVLDNTGLAAGDTALNLGVLDDDLDIAAFTGARNNQSSLAGYRTVINNPATNWVFQDASGDQSADGVAPDVPFDTTAFSLSGGPETQSVGFGALAVTKNEGSGGGVTDFVFTVIRTGGTTGDVTVTLAQSAGGTTAADFAAVAPASVVILAGQTSATVTLQVVADTAVEQDEAFTLTVTAVQNSAGTATSISPQTSVATGNIVNDDIAPTGLSAGSIAFTGFNADGNDDIAFVVLDPIAAGTIIYLNDREFVNGAFNTGEGELVFTATSAIAPGTVVTISSYGNAPTVNVGTISGSSGIGGSEEIIYAFVGTANTPTTFLAAIANSGFTIEGASLAGTGLVEGQSAINLAGVSGTVAPDIAVFTGSRSNQPNFDGYAAIINNPANWIAQDAAGDQSIDTIAPDVPFNAAPFTITGPTILTQGASLQGTGAPFGTEDVVLVRLGATPGLGGTAAGRAEAIAFDPVADRAYVSNAARNSIDILQVGTDGSAQLVSSIDLTVLPSYGGVNSVAVRGGVVAVAYQNALADQPGSVALFDGTGALLRLITVGVLPDQLTFTPDGQRLLVANEGEAVSPANNPPGSITIISLVGGAASATVQSTVTFASLNGQETALRNAGLATFPGQAAGNDIEPEYIAVSPDGTRAYVTLQEVNAVAVIDLTNPAATAPIAILPLGGIDRLLPGNAFDPNDQNGISLVNGDILSLPQPDAIASFTTGGLTYFVTANEGDSRGGGLSDETRLSSNSYVLDPTAYPNAAAFKTQFGRLNVLTNVGDTDGDGDFDQVFTFGGRSISIFRQNADGTIVKVRETGGEFEAIIARDFPALFNTENGASVDTRSDNKGPEPEGVVVGQVGDRIYAFVTLERVGGVMVYDVTDPANAFFVTYRPVTAQDFAPEVITFVSAADSPTGTALALTANEGSGTTTIYSILRPTEGNDTLIGGGDADRLNGRGGADVIEGRGGNDVVIGGTGSDLLFGGEGNDVVVGGDGNDSLFGGTGNNELIGGAGDDLYVTLGNGDTLVEVADGGVDTVQTDRASFTLGADFENLTGLAPGGQVLIGNAAANLLIGSTGSDVLIGGEGNDTLIGGAGAPNELYGGAGDDLYIVRVSGDTIVETADGGLDTIETLLASYTLSGSNVERVIFTGAGNFDGQGNDGANTLIGGTGDDILNGRGGNDILIGGAGIDRLIFDAALAANNVDTVVGFETGVDRLFLDNLIFTALSEGAVPAGAFVTGSAAQDADDRIIYNAVSGALFYDADGNGAGASVQFAVLSPGLNLSASDFAVI